ncbi:MarR family transcriptional regulator, partial [Jatrophihabitans sp.]|uniref:MarR family winged helix-turn-helix transcriptional regulator n=1 Tax=Jatrophihabitans sp. TaxID=1932789 RepID=UPI0030C76AE5|nr:transcriptional regulator, MarR family [Jatrophihabitans sp.]
MAPKRPSGSDATLAADEALAAEWHELMGRYHRITCNLDRELMARHELTVSEFEVLQQLATDESDTVRMHELGERVHLTQSALSRLISRLERDGLLERGMCADDRRSVWAQLTPAGAQRYAEAKPTQRAILRDQAGPCIE